MRGRWIGAAFVAGVALWTAGPLSAQKAPPAFEHDPDLDAADQLAPSQVRQPMPAAVAEPTGAPSRPRKRAGAPSTGLPSTVMAEPAARAKSPRGGAPRIIVCSGVFGKDSSHLKLAAAFDAKNVAYTQVDGGSGGKAMASVLYGKDPQSRLEVWWSNPENRSDTHLIVINGQSGWTAPGGLRLGLTLTELEGLNGKPFKVLGFNKDNVSALTDWNGGALAALPGGCKLGISLRADPNSGKAALGAFSADSEYTSANTALRAINPKVSEILVAY